jgi:signal transduction histidine kinase
MAMSRIGLRGKLLVLLLAFGALPLGVTIVVGYTVSRSIITEQAESALSELTSRQAVHIATELTRQRLLLRTITGQLPPSLVVGQEETVVLSQLLEQSLLEDGIFDGLRLVRINGQIVASVALRNTAPQWPPVAPSTDWSRRTIVVHREAGEVLAYVLAVPLDQGRQGPWLEGHVRAEDFTRLFAMPTHMIGSVESAVFEQSGAPVAVGHEHAAEDLADVLSIAGDHSVTVSHSNLAGTPSLVATAPIKGTDWIFATALPLHVALAPLARLRDTAAVGALGLVLLILLTGVLSARSITTPLHELAQAARRFGKVGIYKSVRRRGSDEVGVLVESFNRMADDLQRSGEEIERLHAEEMERAQQLATVGELASGVAHEIRNPVTGVLGALELSLKELPEDQPSRPLLEEARKQLERIQTVTTQLLRYARPPELREVTVDANHLIERAERVVAAQATSADIQLSSEPSSDPVPVHVDPELMVQVLVNLMLNAMDAMQLGGKLTVWVSRRAPDVWIGVRDTGHGIPPEARSEIFRPFFTTKHQGTGLGLSISHQIVTRHGGSLRAEDTPGGGTTFIIALPLADQEETSSERG